ncbi:MAG: deoxyribonuclease V [Chloroflexota bacterium]|nr:deoxyribonuclease V [Chloroflexota bacterium]
MRINRLHGWQVSIAEAKALQLELAVQVIKTGEVAAPRFIAGADISRPDAAGIATAAMVVLSYPELKVVETQVVRDKLDFPYVPGLLSFRESPLVLAASEKLVITPDLFIVDGHGYAHPRRMGYACHLGLFWDTPTIGCAKSLLCGRYEMPGDEPGSHTEIVDKGEVIGAALRTKTGVKPIFVSIGHKISLENAVYWAMKCCRGYRVPEPTRLAHLAAAGNLEEDMAVSASHRL